MWICTQMGQALAEGALYWVDVILGPGVNKAPLGGRNFEYFLKPFPGWRGRSLIDGVQSRAGTSLKHLREQPEFQRFSIDARWMNGRCENLPAGFETACKKAPPWTVMCAYNKLNGDYCSENHYLLTGILKQEWGFAGFVVSDWGAVHDRVASLRGGVDLEMPGPKPRRVQAVVEAVRNGGLDEAVLDEAVRRILQIVFKAHETPKSGSFDIAAHHLLAQKVASEGMVLLKNNGLLPLANPQHMR
jgi:beta-glucosidase